MKNRLGIFLQHLQQNRHPPQTRHPERSASQICRITERLIGAESKDPGDADRSTLFGVFNHQARTWTFEG
jgi:hypothetical protein